MLETMLSGARGGAMWGSVSSTLVGLGVLPLPRLRLEHAPVSIQELAWVELALGSIVAGTSVGAVIGAFISWGIQSGDAYLYNEVQQPGQVRLKLQTDPRQAETASHIMAQVNREARAERQHTLA